MACSGTTLTQVCRAIYVSNGRYTLADKLSDFTVWRHTRRKYWVNCAVLIGNSAGLRTVLFSRLSHTQNCTDHSGNPTVSSDYLPTPRWHHLKALNSFSRWASHDIYLFKYHFLLHILRFLFFFSDNIMPTWLANIKRQPCFLSIIVTRTRRHTELTIKLTNLMGNLCCAREHSVQFFVQFFYTVKLHSLT